MSSTCPSECKAPPDAKVGDIWFRLEPALMGGDALERRCRKTIPDVDLSTESLSQKRKW